MGSLVIDYGLSDQQQGILQVFAEKIKDLDHPECFLPSSLIRWLQSQDWNVSETERVFREHIAWRKKTKVDTILSWYKLPEVIQKYFPGGICGSDKQGRPLFIAPVGHFDPKSFVKSVTRAEFINSRIFQFEEILRYVLLPQSTSPETSQRTNQLVVVLDMEGLGFKHMSPSWLPTMIEAVTMIESNYPEVLGVCFVINAPSLFYRLYSIVRPLISKVTQEKIHVLTTDYREVLLRYFDPESLPAIYGGTMTDPDGDPRCPSHICWAGVVPESYSSRPLITENASSESSISRSSSAQHLGNVDQYSSVEVNRGAQLNIPAGFITAGSELVWCVFCELHDIQAGVSVQPFAGPSDARSHVGSVKQMPVDGREFRNVPLQEVVTLQRVGTRASPFEGRQKVRQTGFYYLRLDNTYSWMRAKRVRYALKVIAPNDPTQASPTPSNSSRNPISHSSSWHTANSQNSMRHNGAPSPSVSSTGSGEIPVFPVPPGHSEGKPLLVTGGSMDVDISLLFRLLAQLLLVPRLRNTAS